MWNTRGLGPNFILIYLIHVLRLNSGQQSYLRYDWTCSLIFFSHWATQSHTGTRRVHCINIFLLCNICADFNNIKITDKKYILQLIQVLDGNVQNKKQGKRGRLYTSYDAEHLSQHPHFIYSYERSNGKDCVICGKRGKRL